MYCKKCGKEIKNNIQYCTNCGEKIPEKVLEEMQEKALEEMPPKVQSTASDTAKGNNRIKIICLVAVILLLLSALMIGLVLILSDEDEEEKPDTEATVTEEIVESTEMTTTAAESEETTEVVEETAKSIFLLSKVECEQLMDDMLKSESVDATEKDAMADISNVIIESRIAEEYGVRMSDLTDDEKNSLNYLIGKNACSKEGIFEYELEFDEDMECDAYSLQSVARDAYGANDLPETDSMLLTRTEDGTIAFMFADGDEVLNGEGIHIREQEDCYLASLPVFRYGNDALSGILTGYADVLFAKNTGSRFGVTAIYARTRGREDIPVDYVETSSELPGQEGKTYDGNNLIDGDYSTAWVEGVDGVGVGQTITLHLDKPREVYGILLYNGYLASVDLYNKNGKVTQVTVDFGQGQEVKKEIDTYAPQTSGNSISEMNMNIGRIAPDQPVVTDTITITITEAVTGDKYEDTCISEVVVY